MTVFFYFIAVMLAEIMIKIHHGFCAKILIAFMVLHQTTALHVRGETSDYYCGPRCVDYVLKFFAKNSEHSLYDLVNSMHDSGNDSGSPLTFVEHELNQRGVYTQGVKIDPLELSQIAWKYPIILHLKTSSAGSGTGHYVVWLPNSSFEHADIWDGLNGIVNTDYSSLSSRMSGMALITSTQLIDLDNGGQLSMPIKRENTYSSLSAKIGLLATSIYFALRWKLRPKPMR